MASFLKALKFTSYFLSFKSEKKDEKSNGPLKSKSASAVSPDVKKADNDDKANLVWLFCIDMDSVAKRPYDPTIELATHPGKMAPKVEGKGKELMAPTLSVTFRTRYNLYYHVEGLRLPMGVDRNSLQCFLRSSDQHAVIWAPCTAETPATPISGVGLSNDGGKMDRNKLPTMRDMFTYLYQPIFGHSSEQQQLKVTVTSAPAKGSIYKSIHTSHMGVKPVAFVSKVLDSEAAAKLRSYWEEASLKLEKRMKKNKQFDGDGDYEKKYWFRNPTIRFKHYEGKDEEQEKEEEGPTENGNDEVEEEDDDMEENNSEEEDSDKEHEMDENGEEVEGN